MTIITYDIVVDKTRNKVAKVLEDYGHRVQYSVFELDYDRKQLERVIKYLLAKIDVDKDSIRIYTLCKDCAMKVETLGIDKGAFLDEVMVI